MTIAGTGLVLVGLAMLVRILTSARDRRGVTEVRLPWGIEARMPTAVFIGLVVFGAGLCVLISGPITPDDPPPASGPAEVHLATPAKVSVIAPGDDVKFVGTVSGLGDDDKLYMLRQRQPAGEYRIFLPVAYHDGGVNKVDRNVGGGVKKSGDITYKFVHANPDCQGSLDRAGKYTETLDNSCKVRAEVLVKVR
ncbi:MAG: hypothetical protein ACRD0P_37760 [Stackebrandtia sp.]